MRQEIVIIGAGPAGMACAMELYRAGKSSLVVEKDSQVGGLAKTLIFQEGEYVFRTDIGPHRFFSKNKYLYDFVEDLLHEQWIQVHRQTRQLIEGKYYDYPVNALQAFKNIGVLRAAGMGLSYAQAMVTFGLFRKKITNFEDYVVANFGKKLGEFNMLNYTEKIWGIPCTEIHPDWAKQRIKGLNLINALKSALVKNNADKPKTLVDAFYYPQHGTGLIYQTIAEKITTNGSTLRTQTYPVKICHDGHSITKVILESNSESNASADLSTKSKRSEEIEPTYVVSSMPITDIINLLDPRPPEEIFDAIKNLRWRAQVYLFITIDQEQITNDNWIYFPNKEIPFGRISEMKNFSKDMSPKDKTSLFVEFFVNENDEIWNLSKEALFDLTMLHLEKLGMLQRKKVRKYYVFKKRHVYPVYDIFYQKYLETIKQYLDQFENLFYIGRPGRFQYTNQDHSLEMGIIAAKSIINKKRYNLETIGAEHEYFEEGYHKDKKP